MLILINKNIIFIVSILLLPLYSYSFEKKVDVHTSNFPPYSFKKDEKQEGYATELVKYSLNQLNYEIKIQELPYPRAITYTLNKPNTIMYPLVRTKENENQFYWIGKISHQEMHFFRLKNRAHIEIKYLEDLKKYKIGVKRGSYNINYLKNNGIDKIEELTDTIQNILMLSLSRVDLVLLEELEFLHSIEKYNKKNKKKIDFDDFEKVASFPFSKNINPLFIAINKNSNPKFIRAFKKSFEDTLKKNKLIEVANWWTEKSHEKMINIYKKALEKEGYFWVDYTFEGGAGENMQKVLEVREETKRRPHAIQTYLGKESQELFKKGMLIDLNELAKNEKWEEKLPSFINETIQYKGDYFAAPVNMQRVNWIWINPKVFKLSKAKIPKNWQEFYEALEKIKKAGFIPLAIGSEAWQIGTLFENIVLGIGGIDFYKKALIELDIDTLKSSKMLDIFKNFRKIQKFTDEEKEGRTWVEATRLIANGEAAMYFMGDWTKGILLDEGLKYGEDGFLAIATPNTEDIFLNNTDVFVFPKINRSAILAQKALAKVIMKNGVQEKFNMAKGSIPVNQKARIKNFDELSKKSIKVFKKGNIVTSFTFRQNVSKKMHDEIINLINEFFNSNMKEELAIKELLEIVNKNSLKKVKDHGPIH